MSNTILFIHESSWYLLLFPNRNFAITISSLYFFHLSIHSETEIFYYGSKNSIFIIAGIWLLLNLFCFLFLLLFLHFTQCIERNLAISNATYLDWLEKTCPEPSLRVISNRLLTDDDIQFTFDTIENISSELLSCI